MLIIYITVIYCVFNGGNYQAISPPYNRYLNGKRSYNTY